MEILYARNLMGQPKQSASDQCRIIVQAVGIRSEQVILERVKRDVGLVQSLITDHAAERTGARRTRLYNILPVQDETGFTYHCHAVISLQWRLVNTRRSETEDFYVVRSISNGLDARLSKHVRLLTGTSGRALQPVLLSGPTQSMPIFEGQSSRTGH